MKFFIILSTLFTCSHFAAAQQKITEPSLANRIDSLIGEGKKFRAITKELYFSGQSGTKEYAEAYKSMMKTDSVNYVEVKQILNQYGFPGYTMVGKNSSHNFWIMAQFYEKDLALQNIAVTLMKKEVDAQNAAEDDYAFIVDKYLDATGDQQIYGTLIKLNDEHTSFEVKPVKDPEKLDELRKHANLPPLSDTIKQANERFQKSIGASKSH